MATYEIHAGPSRAAVVRLLTSAALPTSDLTDAHMRDFFSFGTHSTLAGVVGLEVFGTDALLRSLVVDPAQRRTGLGTALVKRAEEHALSRGVASIFLLTTTAEAFFTRLGYVPVPRAQAPLSIASTQEFSALCPASSAFMIKTLRQGDAP